MADKDTDLTVRRSVVGFASRLELRDARRWRIRHSGYFVSRARLNRLPQPDCRPRQWARTRFWQPSSDMPGAVDMISVPSVGGPARTT